jgi:nitrogen fixation protein NifB
VDLVLHKGFVPDLIELTGPGDPLADIDNTLATLEMIHVKHPQLRLGIATLGLGGAGHAGVLSAKGLTQVKVQMDAVDPAIAAKLYAWIRPGRKTLPLARAVQCLVDEQAAAVQTFVRAGLKVVVKAVVYPGYNDDHLEEIARRSAVLGAAAMAIHPYRSHAATEGMPPAPEPERMHGLCRLAARHLPVLEEAGEEDFSGAGFFAAAGKRKEVLPTPTAERPNAAVVSTNGMDVDLHLGEAVRVLIYGPREDGLPCLLASREAPEPGGGSARWQELAAVLDDCFVLLTAGAGQNPRMILARHHISILITEGEIEATVDALYGGGSRRKQYRR